MSSRAIWPKLDDDKAFEKLCRDILREKTGLNWQIYGRKGQRQHGIDIKCSVKQTNRIYVAQCKNYTVSDADRLIKDIAGDVEKIVQQTNVDKIFIMTSHDRDNKVQDFITELRGKYTVDIVEEMFWDTITETFSSNATLMAKYEHYIKGRIGFSSPYAHESQLTSLLLFKNSKTHYQRLREGRFAYLKFDENLFADTKPIDILLKNPNEKTETLLDTLKNHEGNFIFIGEGGTGKTTSLLRIWEEWLKEKKELPLYVPLNEYNIEKQKNFITSYLKRYYDNFDLSTTKDPVILLLDGFNEIYRDPNMAVIEEIKLFVARPKTRIVITSRYNLDTYDALEGFVSYNIEPLSSERIEKFWMSVKTANPNLCNVNLPDNPQKLLATPMMLTLFANTCAIKQKSEEKSGIFQFKPFKTNMGPQTKGELIYNYLLCQLVKLVDSKQQNDLYSTYVALFWVAPYAAWRMESKGLFSEEKRTMRQDMEDYLVKNETFIRSSAGTFLDEAIERYKIRCPDKPLKELLFNTAHPDTPSIIDLLVNVFHLLSTEDIRAEKKRYTFRHQHFRDFLSALHIDNALAIALSETGKFIPEEIKDRILPSYIFDMLGGYYGDYQNQEKCNIRTRLHELLDRLRLDDSQAGFAVNNVIGVWRTSRKDQIVDENLSKLNLTNVPLNNILFSTPNRATCFNESTISDITLLPQGHSGGIKSVTFSADESRILTASYDGTVREWDRETGKCLRIFKGHTNGVESAVYSLDGTRILTASWDKTVREWDRETGQILHTFVDHNSAVSSAVYSVDGKRILSASEDNTVREWDRQTGECIRIFKGHTRYVYSAVYSADEICILSASRDETVREWDRQTGKCIRTFKGHTHGAGSAVYSLDGSQILSTSMDGAVREWDRQTGKCLRIFKGHTSYVHNAVYSADESCILSASRDETVREWDRETGKCLRIFKGHTSFVYSAVYSLDGSRILSASGDG
ncbi:MAG: NACHT domain-containing protein, partial [Candidatus Bathyarchaeota archaeon]|nr:NACHT domain-containing protein [Candidatus Termiticorpusculum sp.]